VPGTLTYDVLLEVPGLLRSRDLRAELPSDIQPGGRLELAGRTWIVADVFNATSTRARVDRHLVARPADPDGEAAG
jgi:hypothetical protein